MVSRREFLATSSVAIAGTACTTGRAAIGDENLASSIAELESMRELASPITVDERRGRIERARELMRANSLGAIMLTGGTSLNYFTGIGWGLSERLLTAVVPVTGQAFVVSPAFEEGRAREQLAAGPLDDTEVLTWEEHESPFRLVASGLRARGLSTGRLGIEEDVLRTDLDPLAAALEEPARRDRVQARKDAPGALEVGVEESVGIGERGGVGRPGLHPALPVPVELLGGPT